MLSALKQHFKLPEEEGNQLHIVPENPLPKDKQSHKFELGYNEKPSILRRTVITTLFTTFISPFVAKAFIAIGIFAPQAQAYSAFSQPILNILFGLTPWGLTGIPSLIYSMIMLLVITLALIAQFSQRTSNESKKTLPKTI